MIIFRDRMVELLKPLIVRAHLPAVLLLSAGAALADVPTWDGGGADNNASNPTNWVGDVAPSAADDIVLDATSTKDMTWDLSLIHI